MEPLRPRVHIANRADGGVLYWTAKLYGFAALVVLAGIGVTGLCTYGYFVNQAPVPPDLRRYADTVPRTSRMVAADGTLLGEFAEQWREVVPYERIPPQLVKAFLAAEDHQFFEHGGIYFKGILRAAWRNLVAGDFAQGGSTITQQVAKQFVGSEKSLTRKVKEAILARRLESKYSKKAILAVYLNHIYLGNGSYGVAAAAQRFFGKRLDQLNLAEMATLAGLAQAPSRYSPVRWPARARKRRDDVLEKMGRHGFLTPAEVARWQAYPLRLRPRAEVFGDRHPYFSEDVRRSIVKQFGQDRLLTGGLFIETTIEPTIDAAGYENVDHGARKQDKRQGFRGAEAYLDGAARDTFLRRAAQLYGEGPLEPGRRYLGLVTRVDAREAQVRVGRQSYRLPLASMSWAARWSRTQALNDQTITDVRAALRPGDVIWVSGEQRQRGEYRDWFLAEGINPRWQPAVDAEEASRRGLYDPGRVVLEQVPHPQAAIFTADHRSGYVLAMVGGSDFTRSKYNRAVQACRQPGSTYKPIYYSAALAQGFGYDTLLNDIPRAEIDPVTGEVWVPTNLHGTVENKVTLEYALVFSKNLPSVDIFKLVGAKEVEKWARRLGFTTTIIADKALALGASCTLLHELTRAFAIFARNGRWIEWRTVRRIRDRHGRLVVDNTVYYDPMLSPADRLDRLHATAGVRPRQAIPARAAYLISKLLSEVIEYGFASIVRRTGIKAGGKTGTSSATMDTSFVAFTSRIVTAVWLGDDMRQRPLGKDDAAYMTVVPMWARYMAEVSRGHPNRPVPWEVPAGASLHDRGDHKRGETASRPMPLLYRKHAKPTDAPTEQQGAAPAGAAGRRG